VLAGGGSLGAVQTGMLMEICATGVRPDLIVGVSAGALNGAFLAYEFTPQMLERMAGLWARVRTRDILPLSWGSLLGLIGQRGHISTGRGIRALLERELPYRQFSDTRVPLYIVAAEQQTGLEVLISDGDVIEAVLASTAIPGIYPPVELNGQSLVDGVIATGTPIATALRLGATQLTIVPCGFTCVQASIPRHAVGRAMHAITLLGARQLRADFAQYSDQAQLCIVPPLCPLAYSSYDYSHGAALVSAAREATRNWIADGGLEKREFPHELVAHSHDSRRRD
jgi:NTE family protein